MRALISGVILLGGLLLLPVHIEAGMCTLPHFPPDRSLVVGDDGNNLRGFGGPDYAKAPILKVLNSWEEVGLIGRDGKWAEVETVDGLRGWINAKCLMTRQAYIDREKQRDPDAYQDCGQLGDIVTTFPMDAAGGGNALRLTCLGGLGCVNFTSRMTNAQGETIFEGPGYGESPLIFCQCDYGGYYPTLAGDLDGDGRAEILAEYSPSDLSASSFWLGAFDGKGFVTVLDGKSLVEDPARPDFFVFVDPPGNEYESGVRWLMGFSGWEGGKARGTVFQVRKNPQTGDFSDVYTGEGLFTPVPGGFKLAGWAKPFGLAQ